jgi:hypothetical protein
MSPSRLSMLCLAAAFAAAGAAVEFSPTPASEVLLLEDFAAVDCSAEFPHDNHTSAMSRATCHFKKQGAIENETRRRLMQWTKLCRETFCVNIWEPLQECCKDECVENYMVAPRNSFIAREAAKVCRSKKAQEQRDRETRDEHYIVIYCRKDCEHQIHWRTQERMDECMSSCKEEKALDLRKRFDFWKLHSDRRVLKDHAASMAISERCEMDICEEQAPYHLYDDCVERCVKDGRAGVSLDHWKYETVVREAKLAKPRRVAWLDTPVREFAPIVLIPVLGLTCLFAKERLMPIGLAAIGLS